MKTRALTAVVFLAWSTAAMAAGARKSFVVQQHFTLAPNGTLLIENTAGNIEVFAADVTGVHVEAQKTVYANDAEGIEEGRELTALTVGGNENMRVLRTVLGANRTKTWTSTVSWHVRVPKTVSVRLSSTAGDYIRVFNVRGSVAVKNFNGQIAIENPGGFVAADSVNGSIAVNMPGMKEDVRLATVNGSITARVRADADLRWVADTARGDIRTNLPVRGMFTGTTFRGSVNAPGGPTLQTVSLLGNIALYAAGAPIKTAQSVRDLEPVYVPPPDRGKKAGAFRQASVVGNVVYNTSSGDILIGDVRGAASLKTDAGKVELGAVSGDANVESKGGSLHFGEVLGTLKASTHAGDVLVEAARRGGTIVTDGGTIRLLYTGGPTRLVSGGGDIVVRQAAGAIDAKTRSGDIAITIDRLSKKQKIDAETEKGNIVLNVPEGFGADVDITILTNDPNSHTVQSDLLGLSISREQVLEGRTRVRATGKLNGGGEKITLQATGGSVRIITGPVGPTVIGR